MLPQQVMTAVLNFSSTPPVNDLNAEYYMPIFSKNILIITIIQSGIQLPHPSIQSLIFVRKHTRHR